MSRAAAAKSYEQRRVEELVLLQKGIASIRPTKNARPRAEFFCTAAALDLRTSSFTLVSTLSPSSSMGLGGSKR